MNVNLKSKKVQEEVYLLIVNAANVEDIKNIINKYFFSNNIFDFIFDELDYSNIVTAILFNKYIGDLQKCNLLRWYKNNEGVVLSGDPSFDYAPDLGTICVSETNGLELMPNCLCFLAEIDLGYLCCARMPIKAIIDHVTMDSNDVALIQRLYDLAERAEKEWGC